MGVRCADELYTLDRNDSPKPDGLVRLDIRTMVRGHFGQSMLI